MPGSWLANKLNFDEKTSLDDAISSLTNSTETSSITNATLDWSFVDFSETSFNNAVSTAEGFSPSIGRTSVLSSLNTIKGPRRPTEG